jgi:glucose/arabinose dehydrogenase
MNVGRRFLCHTVLVGLLAMAGAPPTLSHRAEARDVSQGVTDVPPGLSDGEVTTLTGEVPTDLALTPDGRLLIATQGGRIWIVANGTRLASPALDLGAAGVNCSEFERGLQSVEADPDFATNQFVFVFHTYNGGGGNGDCSNRDGVVNRVVRYRLLPNNTMVDPTVIVNNIASPCGNHNGGDLHFGADGLLYISTGDGGTGESDCRISGAQTNNARYRSVLNGKILRIASDGSIPPANPFARVSGSVRCSLSAPNVDGGVCQETFAWGFRNPFRFAFRPGTNRLYVNDVGYNNWEEISDVTIGNDYGWHCREGRHNNPVAGVTCDPMPDGAIDPIYDYPHGGELCAVTGGAFAATFGRWPAPYDGAYLFGDYCSNAIFQLIESDGAYRHDTFARIAPGDSIITLMFDTTTDALYYTTNRGRVGVIRYSEADNRVPVAVASATPTEGRTPLTVQFSGVGSADPEGDPLTYRWNFGDGSPSASGASPTHTYVVSGTWVASLVVADASGVSQPARVTVYAGSFRPSARILSPSAGARFSVGQVVTLTGVATDERGNNLSATMQWRVLLHHVPSAHPETAHVHPVFTGSGNSRQLPPMPLPEDLDAAARSFLEIQLTARDVKGLTQSVTQTLEPNRVALTFTTSPAGLRLAVNGAEITATQTFTSWQGYALNLSTPALQRDRAGQWWRFKSWSDGGTANHAITTGAAAATLTATFDRLGSIRATYLPLMVQ